MHKGKILMFWCTILLITDTWRHLVQCSNCFLYHLALTQTNIWNKSEYSTVEFHMHSSWLLSNGNVHPNTVFFNQPKHKNSQHKILHNTCIMKYTKDWKTCSHHRNTIFQLTYCSTSPNTGSKLHAWKERERESKRVLYLKAAVQHWAGVLVLEAHVIVDDIKEAHTLVPWCHQEELGWGWPKLDTLDTVTRRVLQPVLHPWLAHLSATHNTHNQWYDYMWPQLETFTVLQWVRENISPLEAWVDNLHHTF